jgi:signal transduction histidine kinase
MRQPRRRILIVDDNAALRENLREILDDAGYAVASGGGFQDGLAAARRGFDVALVDLRLPDGDGTLLAQKLKDLNPDGEVVLLTGFATVESAAAAVRAGACAYLVKPCATPELLLTLEQAMRQVNLHEEKRELARRARVVEKLAAVGTLTAGLSHEIRNPLNAAGLQLTVLERRVGKLAADIQAPLMEPLNLVRDEIRRLDHILEDFLQFAKPRDLVPRPVETRLLASKVLDLLEGDAERRGVKLVRAIAPTPPIAGDEERLRQALMNLALNALDATPSGGTVTLSSRESQGMIELVIDDTGPGMSLETKTRIFEPFFTTKASGSGLGLPIVHAIVTQHGGTITVDTAPGGGARFVLALPPFRSAGIL